MQTNIGRINRLISLVGFIGVLISFSYAVADEKDVIDFDQNNFTYKVENGAIVEPHTTPEGKKTLKVTLPAGKKYPGVSFKPKEGAWDFSKNAYVAVKIHNSGKKKLDVFMRADNEGDWKKSPWNTERWGIAPGKSQYVRVWFGYSYSKKGYPLDTSKVIRLLIFTGQQKQKKDFLIEQICVGGKPGDISEAVMKKSRILPKGDLLAMDKADGPKMKVKSKGGEAVAAKTAEGKPAVKISFPADGKGSWPAVFIQSEKGQTWDLNRYSGVDFKVKNTGKKAAKFFFRLDNNNADGKRNCITANVNIKAGESKDIPLSFVTDNVIDIGNKKKSFAFASDVVRGITVFTDKNGAGSEIMIESVKGVKGINKNLPEWLGKRPPVDGDWQLTFEDKFEGEKIDPAKWSLPAKVGEKHEHCNRSPASIWGKGTINLPENAVVKNGKLNMISALIPKDKKYDDPKLKKRKYYSTVPTTWDRFAQKYGYFEARMKLPSVLGQWPAFWLMPDRGKGNGAWWKRQGTGDGGMEFDIMEYLTRYGPYRYHVAMHWDGYGKKHKANGCSDIYFLPDEEGFFTAGLLWEPGKATFFCNGRKVAVWENERVCSVPAYILFTNPFGGWGDIFIDEKNLPDKFVIDYVRVWQREDLKDK